MQVKILYVDVRNEASLYSKYLVEWWEGMTARDAVEKSCGKYIVSQVEKDLEMDEDYLIVSWNSISTEDHSEMGGVDSLDWIIPRHSILVILYQNSETREEILNDVVKWMQENEY